MAISRIDNLRMADRHLFAGIFGAGVVDVFVDSDMRVMGLWEALYRSLHGQGYTVVFYSNDDQRNFFSFRKADLAEFYGLRPLEQQRSQGVDAHVYDNPGKGVADRRFVAPIDSPFGRRRRAGRPMPNAPELASPDNAGEPDYAQIQTVELTQSDVYYRISDTVDPFVNITSYITRNPGSRCVFVFTTAYSDTFSQEQIASVKSKFDTLITLYNSRNIQSHILMLYNCRDSSTLFAEREGEFFRSSYFRDKLMPSAGGERSFELYQMPGPSTDEFRNLLNRRRLLEGLDVLSNARGIEGVAVRLSQETARFDKNHMVVNPDTEILNHLHKMSIDELGSYIASLDADNANDRLRSLDGIEPVVEQLDNFLEALRDSRDGRGPRFRPHLVFSGNPGTGKTTVARLFARILRDENLLERGQLVEATVGDLVGQYVGETRVKTQALCERARGGVLFIDEAYGLMSGAGGHGPDYGAEAIEVLIQFMENSSDSLVILAGYRADMENLIQNGNQGFMRRFNGKDSFIQFDDYRPDALMSIFRRQIKEHDTTGEFDVALRNIVSHKYAHRTANWGNASEMEKLASSIIGQHRRSHRGGPLDITDIPADLMRVTQPVESIDHILAEIQSLKGLKSVKEKLSDLIKMSMGRRKRALLQGEAASEKPNLNFIFTGSPGTGKTTVAHLMAKILYTAGLLDKSQEAVLVQKSDIIKSGVGDTPKAIKKLFADHAGETLFIDEAYGLAEHGPEALNEITNCLTDKRYMNNQAVIMAGYSRDMDKLLENNIGLRSRFTNIWTFDDYTNDELWEIVTENIQRRGMTISDPDECRRLAVRYFDEERKRLGAEFSNARKAMEVVNLGIGNYDKRVFESDVDDFTLVPADFPGFGASVKPRLTARERLHSLAGAEAVVAQLDAFVDTLRDSRDGHGPRFRPHLVFSGNPGTGKTTVARLLAEILAEEQLLESEQLVEATVGDLIGQYVGQTRVKTQDLCDRARGGVLFIDEAYGLMSGEGSNGADYGKEAIEVLIQFMENSKDSLVILAGYRDDMENLIKNGNQGFMRRFNGRDSFIQFDDYSPEALHTIFRRQIEGMETTAEFDSTVVSIINRQHAHRTARWGNAGEMEKMASAIVSAHRRNGSSGPLDVADIPGHFMRVVAPVESVDDILAEVNGLTGLASVKAQLSKLIKKSMGQRRRAMRHSDAAAEKQNLNFIFTGAPGTGKTTVAHLMARILYAAGIMDGSDSARIVQKSDIIKSGVGDTPKAIKKLFADHGGEVLFIDEAYGLAEHGPEAINEITNCLTDPRFEGNQAVILAGYTREMDAMLATNRGLRSRFTNIWTFDDYTNEELWTIVLRRIEKRKMMLAQPDECRRLAYDYFDSERRRLGPEFSNARKACELFDTVSGNYDIREFEEHVEDMTLRPQDFPGYHPDHSHHTHTNETDG